MDTKFKKGMTPWNKGKTGYMGANKTSFKKGDNKIDLEIRFWSKVRKGENCWEWIAFKDYNGYGKINVEGKSLLAHRVSYKLKFGEFDNNICVLHKCDNPKCVKPEHLFLGTKKENSLDMINKNRGCSGENASFAKLSWVDVNNIRSIYKKEKTPMRKLAREFGISQVNVFNIIHNNIWK